jgi:hypothetical protein
MQRGARTREGIAGIHAPGKVRERRMNTSTSTTSPAPAPAAPPLETEFDEEGPFNPVAVLLGFLLPGAGHAYLGEIRRAWLVGGGILTLFFGGMLIGGIDVVDKREDFVWFLGQSLVGPVAFGADYVHQHFIKVRDPRSGVVRSAHPNEIRRPRDARPIEVRHPITGEPLEFEDPRTGQFRIAGDGDRPPNTKSLGRVNEVGTLFCTVAGMLNLICVIDVAKRARVERPARKGAR